MCTRFDAQLVRRSQKHPRRAAHYARLLIISVPLVVMTALMVTSPGLAHQLGQRAPRHDGNNRAQASHDLPSHSHMQNPRNSGRSSMAQVCMYVHLPCFCCVPVSTVHSN